MHRGLLHSLLLGLLVPLSLPLMVSASEGADKFSEAEQIIFMREHLANVNPPQTLRYTFRKSGSLEEGFEDNVTLRLTSDNNGDCCAASADFLNGSRATALPDITTAKSNPVILYFLERDIRDMHRLTGGQPNHFRKRIWMEIYNTALVQSETFRYQDREVTGHRIVISPYAGDPNRGRFAEFADKQYEFTLSDAVPGGVLGIATRMRSANAAPLIVEEMYLEGASATIPIGSHDEHGAEQ